MSSQPIALSVITPLYNEEACVDALHAAITSALAPLGLSYELLLVDDGSRDQTFARAAAVAQQDPRVRIVRFRRNYGQTPAMAAGIAYARGRILVTMDGDLQNDPADIPLFLAKMDEGYDIVVGWRHRRQDKLITRKIPSRIANWLIGKVTGVPIKDNGCSLKAYRADIIKKIPLYSEMHRFIPAMSSLAGTRVAEIKVNHHARQFGVSKYGLSRIYKVLLDLITIKAILATFSRPMKGFALAAAGSGALALATLAYGIYLTMATTTTSPTMVFAASLLYGSLTVALILLGLLAELIVARGDTTESTFALLNVRWDIDDRGSYS